MQSSPELYAFVEQMFLALETHHAETFLAKCSAELGVLHIGTAPSEWVEGLAAFEPLVRAMAEGSGGAVPDDLQIQAFQEGSVGWAAFRDTGRLPDGATFAFRGTCVCHLEEGIWKAVHTHLSIGIPDELVANLTQSAG